MLAAFPGAIATSDTALIDAHATVVDLAGEIIRRQGSGRLSIWERQGIKEKSSRRSPPFLVTLRAVPGLPGCEKRFGEVIRKKGQALIERNHGMFASVLKSS